MTYCMHCGSRDVHVEQWVNVNTGEFVCSGEGDFYCGSCEQECGTTESRHEAAVARLERRREDAA